MSYQHCDHYLLPLLHSFVCDLVCLWHWLISMTLFQRCFVGIDVCSQSLFTQPLSMFSFVYVSCLCELLGCKNSAYSIYRKEVVKGDQTWLLFVYFCVTLYFLTVCFYVFFWFCFFINKQKMARNNSSKMTYFVKWGIKLTYSISIFYILQFVFHALWV